MVSKVLKTTFTLICLFSHVSTGWCVDQTVVYYAVQYGQQDTGNTAPLVGQSGSYLKSLESKHGALKENRQVSPKVLTFDFYKTNGSVASGFGLEVHRYKKIYTFENDPSQVDISAVGLLYGLNFYYRGDFLFPFLGFFSTIILGRFIGVSGSRFLSTLSIMLSFMLSLFSFYESALSGSACSVILSS